MTPEWKEAFRHAGAEADRLGLEMAMAASGGWSETAGPWVKTREAMKKVVWSEIQVQGPKNSPSFAASANHNGRFRILPCPDFQFPSNDDLPGARPQPEASARASDPTFYADTFVLAYRLPDSETPLFGWRMRQSVGEFFRALHWISLQTTFFHRFFGFSPKGGCLAPATGSCPSHLSL